MRLARVAALLIILISLPGVGHGQAPGEPRTCTLGGKVLYAPHLKAAARIPVRVEDSGSGVTVQQALTDSAGSFYFDGLSRGSFEVVIEVEDFLRWGIERVSFSEGWISRRTPAESTLFHSYHLAH